MKGVVAVVTLASASLVGAAWLIPTTYEGVRFERVVTGRPDRKIVVVGPVLPEKHAVVQPKFPSRVAAIYVVPGQKVEPGGRLVLLDATEVTLEVRRKRIAFRKAELRLAQVSEQAPNERSNRVMEVELAELDVESARMELSRAMDQAADAVLVSPIAGSVLNVSAVIGEMLYPGRGASEGVVISAADNYVVRAELDEFAVADLKAGMSAAVRFDAAPGVELRGQVLASPILRRFRVDSRQGATFEVTVAIDGNLPPSISPGLTGVAEIAVGGAQLPARPVVPHSAVVRRNERDYVVERTPEGALLLREVILGEDDEHVVQILSGIEEGAWIAVGDLAELVADIEGRQ